MVSWLDSLSLTSAPLNHRIRYRALCDMRARMCLRLVELTTSFGDDLERQAVTRAAAQLESMHRYADQYLRVL